MLTPSVNGSTAAERKVMRRYEKLHKELLLLTKALQELEPAGSIVDHAKFKRNKNGTMRVAYKARPTVLEIEENGQRFRLRLEELK